MNRVVFNHALRTTSLFLTAPCPCLYSCPFTASQTKNNKEGPERKQRGSRRNQVGHEIDKADLRAVHSHACPHRRLRVPHLDCGAAASPLVVCCDMQMLQVHVLGEVCAFMRGNQTA